MMPGHMMDTARARSSGGWAGLWPGLHGCLGLRAPGPGRVLRPGRVFEAEWLDGSGGDGEEAGAGPFEGGDVVDVTQGQADVVEAFHKPPAGVVVDLKR